MLNVRPGDVVEWDTWCGPSRFVVVAVYCDGIATRAPDGFTERWERLPAGARVVAHGSPDLYSEREVLNHN